MAPSSFTPIAKQEPGQPRPASFDSHETLLGYNPPSKLPIPVVLVWICAFLGLGAYMVTLYLPDLALWNAP